MTNALHTLIQGLDLMIDTLWQFTTNPPVFFFLSGLIAAALVIFLVTEFLNAPLMDD